MPASKPSAPRSGAPAARVVLLPAAKFFVRRIPLVAGQDPAAQAALALEAIGPFAPGQLFHGHVASADGTQALVFAAYRKNFAAADTAAWVDADAVLPAFAVWLGLPGPTRTAVWLLEDNGTVAALFWDGHGSLPAGMVAREVADRPPEAVRAEVLEEVKHRLGGNAPEAKTFHGATAVGPLGKEGLALSHGEQSAVLAPAVLRAMDVRDKGELAGQISRRQRDSRLWLGFAAAVGGLAACIAVELGLLVSHGLLARQQARMEAAAPAVREVEQANKLVARMEQLAGQSLRPLEMLALLNAARPATLEFVRATTGGPRLMKIEARSSNAADQSTYEQALKRLPEVEKVELRDPRTTGGRTIFFADVTFRAGFAGQGGGAR